jgi:hypothetical protein
VELLSKPLFLNARTILGSNTTGGVNAIALRNPMHLPMEILAITFQLEMPGLFAVDEEVVPVGNILGGIIAAKIDLGQYPITNGYVPVWNMGRSVQAYDEAPPWGPFVTDPSSPTGQSVPTTQTYQWVLPRPLYVPADSVLTPTFQHRGLFTDPITVNVGYVCRSLPADYVPKKINLPYAAAFVTKNFDLTTIAANGFPVQQTSTETDLVNSFDETLILQRFTGRALMYNNANPKLSDETGQPLSAWANAALEVRMIDSHGRPIIPNFTNFRAAFAGMTRSWEMDKSQMMDKRSYYIATVNMQDLGDPASDTDAFTLQAAIGLVGWREIS